jgi:hypothetical protein
MDSIGFKVLKRGIYYDISSCVMMVAMAPLSLKFVVQFLQST